jgi:hypothetical protein
LTALAMVPPHEISVTSGRALTARAAGTEAMAGRSPASDTLLFLKYRGRGENRSTAMYAQVFGVPIRAAHGIEPYWNAGTPAGRVQDHALNAIGREIAVEPMLRHLRDPRGARLFHPVRRPVSATVRASCARSEAGAG